MARSFPSPPPLYAVINVTSYRSCLTDICSVLLFPIVSSLFLKKTPPFRVWSVSNFIETKIYFLLHQGTPSWFAHLPLPWFLYDDTVPMTENSFDQPSKRLTSTSTTLRSDQGPHRPLHMGTTRAVLYLFRKLKAMPLDRRPYGWDQNQLQAET